MQAFQWIQIFFFLLKLVKFTAENILADSLAWSPFAHYLHGSCIKNSLEIIHLMN